MTWDITPALTGFEGILNWIIIGGASVNSKLLVPPELSYVQNLHQWADAQNIPVFHKGNLGQFLPADQQRQEFPAVKLDERAENV